MKFEGYPGGGIASVVWNDYLHISDRIPTCANTHAVPISRLSGVQDSVRRVGSWIFVQAAHLEWRCYVGPFGSKPDNRPNHGDRGLQSYLL